MPKVLDVLSKSEYASYYATYLEKVDFNEPVKMLIEDLEDQLKIIEGIPEKDFSYRYKKENGH